MPCQTVELECQTVEEESQSSLDKADSSQSPTSRDERLDNATESVLDPLTTPTSIQNSSFENKEIDIVKKSNISPAFPAGKNNNPFVPSYETVNHEQQSEKTHTGDVLNPLYTITLKPR